MLGALISSCNDFLDREPITQPNSESFLNSEQQIASYVDGLYTLIPRLAPYSTGIHALEINSDNVIGSEYNKRIAGEYTVNSAELDWQAGYEALRNANYFFANNLMTEDEWTDEIRSYVGEVYFFRAYWHYYLLTRFGNVPLMTAFWDNNATVAGLQIPQTPRNEVAKFILSDLDKAYELLFARSQYKGLRLSKEAALIFAMRVALYEGTWEKYHARDAFASLNDESMYFLERVMYYGDTLFESHPDITLNSASDDSTAEKFGEIFRADDLSSISEAVFWKKYSLEDGITHYFQSLLTGGTTIDNNNQGGVSLSLVNSYLNADGTVYDYRSENNKDFNMMFEGRDPRLLQTIMNTGDDFRSLDDETKKLVVKEYVEPTGSDVNYREVPPQLNADGGSKNTTGFHVRLSLNPKYDPGVNTMSQTAVIYIRYAEALLAYAEAAAELGLYTAAVGDKTIKLLRERAGVEYSSSFVNDEVAQQTAPDYGYSITPDLREIRRERRVELALQDFRLDDLMRWSAHNLLKGQRGRGAYFGEDGILYKSFSASDITTKILTPVDDEGWLDPLRDILPAGYNFNEGRDYLLPIPTSELQFNKTLEQNPGWNN